MASSSAWIGRHCSACAMEARKVDLAPEGQDMAGVVVLPAKPNRIPSWELRKTKALEQAGSTLGHVDSDLA